MSRSLVVILTIIIVGIGGVLAFASGWPTAIIVTVSLLVIILLGSAIYARRSQPPLEQLLRQEETITARGFVLRGLLLSPPLLAVRDDSYRVIHGGPITELPVVAVSDHLQGSASEFDFRSSVRLWTPTGSILFSPLDDAESLLRRLVAAGVPTRGEVTKSGTWAGPGSRPDGSASQAMTGGRQPWTTPCPNSYASLSAWA